MSRSSTTNGNASTVSLLIDNFKVDGRLWLLAVAGGTAAVWVNENC